MRVIYSSSFISGTCLYLSFWTSRYCFWVSKNSIRNIHNIQIYYRHLTNRCQILCLCRKMLSRMRSVFLQQLLDDRSFSFCHLYMMYGMFFFSPCHCKRPPMINCIIEGLEITLLQTFYHSLAFFNILIHRLNQILNSCNFIFW